jgi:serine/threonine-protein kinase
MDVYSRLHETTSSGYALPLNNLASADEDMGDYAQAEPLFRQSLALRQKLYTADNPSVARAEHNLARVLTEEGKLDAAKPLLDRVLSIRIAKFGADHPDTVRSQLLLAEWLLRSNALDQAQATMDALAKSHARLTPVMTAQRWQLQGRVARARGDNAMALDDFRQAHAAMVTGWGETHPLTAAMALDYVGALRNRGRNEEAHVLLERIRPIIETAFVAKSPMRRQLDSLGEN